jgi:pimeloyl-ACP methyl ester carboxylesterase
VPDRLAPACIRRTTIAEGSTERLERVIKNRVGRRSDGGELARAYADGAAQHALNSAMGSGPVPTSLPAERAALMIEVSRKLGRLVEDYEIEALLRLTSGLAKSVRRTLVATYTDIAAELLETWSLKGSRARGRLKGDDFAGEAISFADEDRRDAFVEAQEKVGIPVQVVHGDADSPWMVIVGDEFPADRLPGKGD